MVLHKFIALQNIALRFAFFVESSRLFIASLFIHVKEKASKVSAKHTGGGAGVIAQSEQEKWRDCSQL